MQCYQCDSNTAGCRTSELATAVFSPCKKYLAEDNCYTAVEGGILYRGCESDEAHKCNANNNCEACKTNNGCNDVVGSTDVTCNACTDCGTNAQVDKICSEEFEGDTCGHSITSGVVFKGCASECNDCTKCKGDKCNNQLYCFTCDSNTESSCLTNPATSTSTLCAVGATCITATGII